MQNSFTLSYIYHETSIWFQIGHEYTDKTINTLLDIAYPAFDFGEYAFGTFLELSKALDIVHRRNLLRKLYFCGIIISYR